MPVFVVEILMSCSSKDNHCSQMFIKERLQKEPYCINVDKRTVSRCIGSLLREDLFVFGDTRECWYDHYPKRFV